jgi:hypothetical protein
VWLGTELQWGAEWVEDELIVPLVVLGNELQRRKRERREEGGMGERRGGQQQGIRSNTVSRE